MERMVTLNNKEQKRLMVISKVERGEVGGREAAALLGISLRHFRRIMAGYRREGARALAHGNRGRRPANVLDGVLSERVTELASSIYAGCNTQHFTELLAEREDIRVSRSSVRRILIANGLSGPRKRRAPQHRSRRERYPQEGMLVQMDGSRHDWLEGRGPQMTLIGAIDDATGKILHALFRQQEDAVGYFQLLQGIVRGFGIPLAVYHDGHAVFEHAASEPFSVEEQLEGGKRPTQFGRLLAELNITSIRSHSPQARGRIERAWGTFQDRLVSELRLAGASTMAEANEVLWGYLPGHNQKFAVPAARPGTVFRSPGRNPDALFCFKYPRTVGLDNVVRFGPYRLQVLSCHGRYSYARSKVEVHQAFDGSISVYYENHRLDTRPAPAEATKLRESANTEKPEPPNQRHYAKPALNHPWRVIYRQFIDKGNMG